MYSEAKFEMLMADAKAEHRQAATGSLRYPSDELFERLVDLGRAIEAGELPSSLLERAARGARSLNKNPSPSSS